VSPTTCSYTVEKCPLCGSKEVHIFEYELELVVAARVAVQKNAKPMTFFVTCPTKNETYEITIPVESGVEWIRVKTS
jgi:hypothetical protein